MNYREADVLVEESVTSGTKTVDIELTDVISRLLIRMKAQNGSDRCAQAAHPAKLVSKIELVDGSDVLYSLSGYEAMALNYYDNLVTPDSEIIDGGSDWQHAEYLIDFGRFLNDPVLAFDPTKFVNPQLKITYDYQAVDDGAVAGKLLVKADIFDEKRPSPTGFLMNKDIETYTLSGAAYKYVDIPRDYGFRKLLIRTYLTNKSFESEMDEIRLSEDIDKRIPIDTEVEPYIRKLCGTMPPMHEHFQTRLQTTVTHTFVMPTYWPMVYGTGMLNYDVNRDGGYYSGEDQGMISATNMAFPYMGVCYGYVPHQTLAFMFGDQGDMADWYDVTKLGSLRLRLHGVSSSTAESTIFGQQMRPY